MNPNILAGLLKNFYAEFNMGNFNSRLKLQKIIYLLQAYGLNIGYNYEYYLYGPYSTELTRDGYSMPRFSDITKIEFQNKEDQNKFQDFIEFIGNRKEDVEWLEITASAHFLLLHGNSENTVIDFISKKRQNKFIDKKDYIKKIINQLKSKGLLKC